jgi:hypothetical protein
MWTGTGLTTCGSLQFRSKRAHEALTKENMGWWAHARVPTLKQSCSSEQTKQAHVPTSRGTPERAGPEIGKVSGGRPGDAAGVEEHAGPVAVEAAKAVAGALTFLTRTG